jgi:hypothetical protein
MGHPASTLISKNQFIFKMNQLVVFDRYMKSAAWIRSVDETGYGRKRLSAGALNDDRFDLDLLFEELGIVGLKGFKAFEPKNSDQETIMDVIRPKIIRKLVNLHDAEWDRKERSGLLPVSPSQSRSPSPQPLPQVSLEVNEASPKQRSSRKVMLSLKHPPGDSPLSEQHYTSSSRAQDLESSNTSITNPPGGWEDEDEEVLENGYPI